MPALEETTTGTENTGAGDTGSPTGNVEGQDATKEKAKVEKPESQTQAKAFSQAEVDALLGKTRQEGRDRATNALLQETGMKDVEALKALVLDAEEKRKEQLSDLDKITEENSRLKPFEQLATEQTESLTKYEKAVGKHVESLMETLEVPDHVKPLLEQMDSLAKLAYLTEHGAAFSKQPASPPPNSNVSNKGGGKNGKDRIKKAQQKYGIR
jgi:uncharacterized protein YaaN involved in tellurite resistance